MCFVYIKNTRNVLAYNAPKIILCQIDQIIKVSRQVYLGRDPISDYICLYNLECSNCGVFSLGGCGVYWEAGSIDVIAKYVILGSLQTIPNLISCTPFFLIFWTLSSTFKF